MPNRRKDPKLEEVLGRVEASATAVADDAQRMLAAVNGLTAAAAEGHDASIRRHLGEVERVLDELRGSAKRLRGSYALDVEEHLRSGAYLRELHATAEENDLAMVLDDDEALCFPSTLRTLPDQAALEIDRRVERRLRPSAVVAQLLRQQRGTGSTASSTRFLRSLEMSYDVLAQGRRTQSEPVLRLIDLWGVLTLLPGQSRRYTKHDFARDLYHLDCSDIQHTRSRRPFRLTASTGSRGPGVLRIATPTGAVRDYWGIAFGAVSKDEDQDT